VLPLRVRGITLSTGRPVSQPDRADITELLRVALARDNTASAARPAWPGRRNHGPFGLKVFIT
jgi:hypothetical protein